MSQRFSLVRARQDWLTRIVATIVVAGTLAFAWSWWTGTSFPTRKSGKWVPINLLQDAKIVFLSLGVNHIRHAKGSTFTRGGAKADTVLTKPGPDVYSAEDRMLIWIRAVEDECERLARAEVRSEIIPEGMDLMPIFGEFQASMPEFYEPTVYKSNASVSILVTVVEVSENRVSFFVHSSLNHSGGRTPTHPVTRQTDVYMAARNDFPKAVAQVSAVEMSALLEAARKTQDWVDKPFYEW